MPRGGIEPTTPSFSEKCSTTELPWRYFAKASQGKFYCVFKMFWRFFNKSGGRFFKTSDETPCPPVGAFNVSLVFWSAEKESLIWSKEVIITFIYG